MKCYTEWLRTGNTKLLEVLMKYGGFDEADPTKSEVFVVLPDDGRGAPGAVAISEDESDALMADQ